MPEATDNPVPAQLRSLPVPHLSEYFGVWSILEDPFRAAVERAKSVDLHLHIAQAKEPAPKAAKGDRKEYAMQGRVAVIEIEGEMMKFASSFGGSGTVAIRRQLRAAVADDDVGAIVLRIDSPGGTVSGTQDLADDVAAAAAKKPVHAFMEDMTCSAAYWTASQASKVFVANATTIGGCIGTFAVLYDQSGQAAMEGVKVHVIRAGEFKGGTVAGAPVEQKTLEYWQQMVEALNEQFIRAVAAGRGLTLARARELADGRAHVGQAIVDLGLADGMQSFDATVAALEKKAANTTIRRTKAMSTETNPAAAEQAPKAATIHELKAGCPGADDTFVCQQLTANATLTHAQAAWMAEQNRRLAAAREETDAAKAAAAKPGVAALGTKAKAAAESDGASAAEQWHALVQANVAKGMRNDRAVRMAAVQHPDVHKAYIAEYNAETNARRAEASALAEAKLALQGG